MKCYMHPTIDATHTCAECGKGICESCEIDVNGKVYCRPCTEKLATRQASADQIPPVLSGQLGAQAPPRKEPIIALVLSFFIPGLGQLYNGLFKKGIITIITFAFLGFLSFACTMGSGTRTSDSSTACCACILWLALLAVWFLGMYDAYSSAVRINRGETIKDNIF